MKKATQGVVYIATGRQFVNEALASAASLKKHMPDLPVTLFTDEHVTSEHLDNVVKIQGPKYSVEDKVRNISKSPYDHTLFLDTDTYVCDDFSELFELLERFDIAVSTFPLKRRSPFKGIPESFMPIDGCNILSKRSAKTQKLFSDWLRLYLRDKTRGHVNLRNAETIRMWKERFRRKSKIRGIPNAPSLNEALYKSDLRFAILTEDYNFRARLGFVNGKIKIIHKRECDFDAVYRTINAKHSRRVYIWCDKILHLF